MSSMVAPPCHHVNAMVSLCRLLASRDGVTFTVVLTEEWLGLLGAPAALPESAGP